MTAPSRGVARRLAILADGGALSDYNERLGYEGAPRKDFARIPDAVRDKIGQGTPLHCPIESRIFCTVGSEKAQGFLTKMGEAWTVRAFPLSFARYDRVGEADADKHRFRLRYHAYLGYALGLLVGAGEESHSARIVGVVSDDPHLLPCMSDAQASGLDVRLVWWESSISEEVSYLAARNGVPLVLLAHDDAPREIGQRRDTALRQLLGGSDPGR